MGWFVLGLGAGADTWEDAVCPAGPAGREEAVPGLAEGPDEGLDEGLDAPENMPFPEEELCEDVLWEDGRDDGPEPRDDEPELLDDELEPELRLDEPELRENELLEDEPELLCEEDECELLCPLGGIMIISCFAI